MGGKWRRRRNYWGGNCSEAVRGLLDWAVEEDRELAERLEGKR